MKKNYYTISAEEKAIESIKTIYTEIVNDKCSDSRIRELVISLISMQKENGSWGVIDTENCDSDIRVHYIYEPTYYATAALINVELFGYLSDKTGEKNCLMKGLEYASRRELSGHGFQATESKLRSLNIYKNAGVYEWIQKNPKNVFSRMIHKIIEDFRTLVDNNRTLSDWNVDFRNDYLKEIDDYENAMNPYVWYACYGSNVNKERFMRYINRCSDTTPPVPERPFVFDHNIYFAKSSSKWHDGGKAFLDDTAPGKAYGRIYKITRNQFEQIKGFEGKDYTKRLSLGMLDGIPVCSFTDVKKNIPVTVPSDEYYETILNGLIECYRGIFCENELNQYLVNTVFPDKTFDVVRIIKENDHCISTKVIADRTGISVNGVKAAVKWLVEHNVIKQDSRSIREGHSINNKDAYFYTCEGHCARMLVGKILEHAFTKS